MTALLMPLMNLLAERPQVSDDGFPITWLNIGEALVYALLGFAVTFLGIIILIFFVWAYGKIIKAARQGAGRKAKAKEEESAAPSVVTEGADGEIPVEVRLAIVVAIAAYYEGESSKCEFKVKRIKRL